MSERMLHILAPSRYDGVAAIVGDVTALSQLRTAIDDALKSGTGGTFLFQSDCEGYSVAVLRTDDMYPVHTSYAGEVAPQRSRRETVSLRALPHFADALCKAAPPTISSLEIPRLVAATITKEPLADTVESWWASSYPQLLVRDSH